LAIDSEVGCRVKIGVHFNVEEVERPKVEIVAVESTLPKIFYCPSSKLVDQNKRDMSRWKDIRKKKFASYMEQAS